MANLENVPTDKLREVLGAVEDPEAAIRVMAAITYKEVDGLTQKDIARMYGFSSGWVSKWFRRLERLEEESYENVVFDRPRSGRPPELTDSEFREFTDALHSAPAEAGMDAPGWTVPLARQYLRDAFDVEYSTRHVRRLMIQAGLDWQSVPTDEGGDTPEAAAGGRTIWLPRNKTRPQTPR